MELTIINSNGKLLADSREVAEMIGKRHSNLLRDIQGYEKVISENSKLSSQDFFIKDTYKVEGNNKTYDCYLLTKQGCEMVANKMTGEKGILFTAEYVQAFNKMEETLINPEIDKNKTVWLSDEEILIRALSIVKEVEEAKKQLRVKEQIINQILKEVDLTQLDKTENKLRKVEFTEEDFRNLIVEFMNENDVVIKRHPQGLVVDKAALYNYMAQYGWTQRDVLEALDRYNMIYHSGKNKTQILRINGKKERQLVIR